MGLTEAELVAVNRFRDSPVFSDLDKEALELAERMTLTPTQIPEDLRQSLVRQLGKAGFTELAATVAWENHRARLNRALGVREAGFSDGAYCVVPG